MCAFRWRPAAVLFNGHHRSQAILSALRTRDKLQVATAAEPPKVCALLEAIGHEFGIDSKPLDQLRCATGYGFFFGWSSACFGWSGACFELFSPRTIFPSQEIYAVVISSRSFFRLNSISAILCSSVLCSSGICSFLSGWDSIGKLIRYCELSATVQSSHHVASLAFLQLTGCAPMLSCWEPVESPEICCAGHQLCDAPPD